MRRYALLLALLAVGGPGRPCPGGDERTPVIAILGAFGEEVEIIEARLEQVQFHTLLGIDFITGEFKQRRIVLAQTGIGKVNAAMTTTLLIHEFRPCDVIFTGIAGGIDPNLSPGDIVVAEKVAHHDLVIYTEDRFDSYQVRNPLTGRHNPIFLPADTRLLDVAQKAREGVHLERIVTDDGERVPRIVSGTIVSGDAFVASAAKAAELRRRFQAAAVEMEGAAVAQVCYQQQLPFVIVRSLSNTADSDVRMDTARFNHVAAHNSARYVLRIVELLAADLPPGDALSRQTRERQSVVSQMIETANRVGHDYEARHGDCCRCTVAALQSAIRFVPNDKGPFRAACCVETFAEASAVIARKPSGERPDAGIWPPYYEVETTTEVQPQGSSPANPEQRLHH